MSITEIAGQFVNNVATEMSVNHWNNTTASGTARQLQEKHVSNRDILSAEGTAHS
jgi:hypothetical protein